MSQNKISSKNLLRYERDNRCKLLTKENATYIVVQSLHSKWNSLNTNVIHEILQYQNSTGSIFIIFSKKQIHERSKKK